MVTDSTKVFQANNDGSLPARANSARRLPMNLGIIVNPFSGRDVRRIAARASTSDHQEKQQQVTRLVLGALSMGVQRIFLANEPFRINEKAVENLPVRHQVEILRFKLQHSAQDTKTMCQQMWQAGCRVFIVLGGDGTSRIVASELPDSTILPLSTGTNNVFPYRVEASVAGVAAGLVATHKVTLAACQRCKRIRIKVGNQEESALIDAVLLRNDYIGSLLPFAAENLDTIILTRAEPASIGISPIGGYLMPSRFEDDFGVVVQCRPDAGRKVKVPISPGLHQDVGIANVGRLDLDQCVNIQGPGIIAVDGDRIIRLVGNEIASFRILRDGPRVIQAERVMAYAALNQSLAKSNMST